MDVSEIFVDFLDKGSVLLVEDLKMISPLLSRIRRVRLSEKKVFLVKENVVSGADPMLQLLSAEANCHEIRFYLTVVPCLTKLVSASRCLPLADCALARADLQQNSVLVLEDLTVSDYKPADLLEPLSVARLRLAVQMLARVQAAAHKLARHARCSLSALYPQPKDDGA